MLLKAGAIAVQTANSKLHVIYRVGQNRIYTVYIWYFWQGNHQIYGYIRCIYTVLANPSHVSQQTKYRTCQVHHLASSQVLLCISHLILYVVWRVGRVGQNQICTPYMAVCTIIYLLKLTYIHRICRVGQNRIYTPYMTVYLVISLPKLPFWPEPYIYGV